MIKNQFLSDSAHKGLPIRWWRLTMAAAAASWRCRLMKWDALDSDADTPTHSKERAHGHRLAIAPRSAPTYYAFFNRHPSIGASGKLSVKIKVRRNSAVPVIVTFLYYEDYFVSVSSKTHVKQRRCHGFFKKHTHNET